MPTIELTLHKEYCIDWNLFESIRELIQNARDGEVEFNARMEIQYRDKSDTLVIKNHDFCIKKESLLIGFSTKRGKENLVGKFGEGLNLGLLALVRNGLNVTIRSGDEVWKPVIEKSSKFDAEVLKIRISKASTFKNRTAVEVSPIKKDEWEKLKELFLFLSDKDDPRLRPVHKVSTGKILLHEEMKGMVFTKGIFVSRMPDFQCGYDVDDVKLDRDRRMVDSYDFRWTTARMWAEAVKLKQADVMKVYSMLGDDIADVRDYGHCWDAPAEGISEKFTYIHGKNATPVENIAQSKEVEHLGKIGVVVSVPLKRVLEKVVGTYESRKQTFVQRAITFISYHELSQEEKNVLSNAVEMIEGVIPSADIMERTNIVIFADPNTKGHYKGGKIALSRNVLSSLTQTLATLAHEVVHCMGEDGEAVFHHTVEILLAEMAANQFNKKTESEREGDKRALN